MKTHRAYSIIAMFAMAVKRRLVLISANHVPQLMLSERFLLVHNDAQSDRQLMKRRLEK